MKDNFVPDQKVSVEIPFYSDVTSDGGRWRGHTTSKSVGALEAEVTRAFGNLDALIVSFVSGTFYVDGLERQGYRIEYAVSRGEDKRLGRMEIAALPVKKDEKLHRTYEKRRKGALKQMLYMIRDALRGLLDLQVLAPGTAPMLLWLLDAESGKTFSQLWIESSGLALPPGEFEFVDGYYEEIEGVCGDHLFLGVHQRWHHCDLGVAGRS